MVGEVVERLSLDVSERPPYHLEVTSHDVVMRGLPEALHGATFVQLSDLHAGFGGLEEVYAAALEYVNSLNPDLIFFTGDFVDRRDPRIVYPIADYLAGFRSRLGKIACLGNHDNKRGAAMTCAALRSADVQPLVNETVCIQPGLTIAGIDDLTDGAPDINGTLNQLPKDRTSIVLCHNPRLIDRVTHRDILILSGHTHGAQFRLRFPPPQLICMVHLGCWQVAGWYKRGAVRLYVNRGLGVTGKPYRIDCPAEISVFRMLSDRLPAPVAAPVERGVALR